MGTQMAEGATRDQKVLGSITAGSNEIVFLNITCNDGYFFIVNPFYNEINSILIFWYSVHFLVNI